MSPKLRIAYVPEHFASPLLQLAAKDSSVELVPCPSASALSPGLPHLALVARSELI